MNANVELATVIHALKVAEHRSFRCATEALGICQSSIKPVRKLENMLGVDLFDRYHAGVKVTNAGRQFFEHTRWRSIISTRQCHRPAWPDESRTAA